MEKKNVPLLLILRTTAFLIQEERLYNDGFYLLSQRLSLDHIIAVAHAEINASFSPSCHQPLALNLIFFKMMPSLSPKKEEAFRVLFNYLCFYSCLCPP